MLPILKRNADTIIAQGLGSLANKIYRKPQAFATSLKPLFAWEDKDLYLYIDDDEYVPDIESNGDEDVISIGKKIDHQG